MTTIYIAQMRWCEREEPICAGTNKKLVAKKALAMLKQQHGTGPVHRGQAMCSLPITYTDIEVIELPFVSIQNEIKHALSRTPARS